MHRQRHITSFHFWLNCQWLWKKIKSQNEYKHTDKYNALNIFILSKCEGEKLKIIFILSLDKPMLKCDCKYISHNVPKEEEEAEDEKTPNNNTMENKYMNMWKIADAWNEQRRKLKKECARGEYKLFIACIEFSIVNCNCFCIHTRFQKKTVKSKNIRVFGCRIANSRRQSCYYLDLINNK